MPKYTDSTALDEHVATMASSERGNAALCGFWGLLQDGATGLDGENWKTMEALVGMCRRGGVPTVLGILERAGCARRP